MEADTSSSSSNNTTTSNTNQRRMQTIVDNLNKMRAEQRALSQKVSELELDASEHRLVIDALKEVNMDRTCYRLIGGILIEQTVQDVLPDLDKNFDMLKKTIVKYRENVKAKGASINEYIQQHNLAPMIRAQNTADPSAESSGTTEKQKPKDSPKPSSSVLVE